jgi:hypothetical protein
MEENGIDPKYGSHNIDSSDHIQKNSTKDIVTNHPKLPLLSYSLFLFHSPRLSFVPKKSLSLSLSFSLSLALCKSLAMQETELHDLSDDADYAASQLHVSKSFLNHIQSMRFFIQLGISYFIFQIPNIIRLIKTEINV